jgi:hypothetical protein
MDVEDSSSTAVRREGLLRRSIAPRIGRAAVVLALVALFCAPLAAAGAARRADNWTLVRSRANAPATKKDPRASRREAAARRAGKKSRGAFDRAGFSIGGGFQNQTDAEIALELNSMKTAGARWVRMDVNWAVIQAGGPSSYDWARFDRVAASARSRGFTVLAEILYTPGWARVAGAPAESPPANLEDYARFARAAVAHYAPLGIHAYEVWNEPNNASFWQPRADVARYTAMLKVAYPAIKSVDPSAIVVSGGMSPAVDDRRNISPLTFLRGIYANGGKGFFDAVGHHPYCYPAYPGDARAWSAWYQMYGTSPSLRSIMADNGDSGKQIWATEFGAPTNGPSGTSVGEQTQAAMLTRAFDLFQRYGWAGPMFWYSQRDVGTTTDSQENFYGILRHDFSAKPAFAAYATATGAR